ncbi:MAG: hypothetical protein QGI45_02075, partial [Myxococcota bacterium]|nr:hypothetical protein [Myxococcota bacterium]
MFLQLSCINISSDMENPAFYAAKTGVGVTRSECTVLATTPSLSSVLQDLIDANSCSSIEIVANENDVSMVQLDDTLVIRHVSGESRTLELIGPVDASLFGPTLLAPAGGRHIDVVVEHPDAVLDLKIKNFIFQEGDVSALLEPQGGSLHATTEQGSLILDISKSAFLANKALQGGAISLNGLSGSSALLLSDVRLENNQAQTLGGAIFSTGAVVEIVGSNMQGNRAAQGASIYGDLAEVTVGLSTFFDNQTPYCGDDHTDGPGGFFGDYGELCDDGNQTTEDCVYGLTSCDVCDAQCQSVAGVATFCGDSVVQAGEGEECDAGSNANGSVEECAYGLAECLLCDAECQSFSGMTSFCGDGGVDALHETCDDADADSGDGCAGCAVEAGWACANAPSVCSDINECTEGTDD